MRFPLSLGAGVLLNILLHYSTRSFTSSLCIHNYSQTSFLLDFKGAAATIYSLPCVKSVSDSENNEDNDSEDGDDGDIVNSIITVRTTVIILLTMIMLLATMILFVMIRTTSTRTTTRTMLTTTALMITILRP